MWKICFISLVLIGLPTSCINSSYYEKLKISDSCYYGSDYYTIVYVNVINNNAVADFIYWDKFPRGFISDTLEYNESSQQFFGQFSKLFIYRGKFYIGTNDTSTIFNYKFKIKLSSEKSYDKKIAIDNYKRMAILNSFYDEYLKNSTNEILARKKFYEIKEKYLSEPMFDTINFIDFVNKFEKFKAELKFQ